MKNRKSVLLFITILLVSFISGCIGGGQFGAPSNESTGIIKGVVVAPNGDCFTGVCPNPVVTEGSPLPNADIILKGENQTLSGKTDCKGEYEISGLTDEGYLLYANQGEVWIKKAISPVTGDGGEANYLTTTQVFLWEVIENSFPGSISIKDIPTAVPFEAIPQELIDAVKAALADCRDAQKDPICIALAKKIAVTNFGAPCPCIEVTPTPSPGCPIGLVKAVITATDLGDNKYKFDASNSAPQSGEFAITSYAWKIFNSNGTEVYSSSEKSFEYSIQKPFSVSLTVKNECEENSTSQDFKLLPARLTVVKALDGTEAPPATPWEFKLTGPNNFSSTFNLPDNGNWSKAFENLEPGEYTIQETQQNGYQCTKIEVSIPATIDLANCKATFTLESAADVTVTFTNKKIPPARLTVVKALDGTEAPPATPWEFKLTGPNNFSSTFNLPDNGNWSKAFENLEPGEYIIQETQKNGYQCTKIEVSIPATIDLANCKATFTLESAADVTVTFTNKKIPPAKLTIKKVLESGSNAPGGPWLFNITGPGINENFTLNANQEKVFDPLEPGNYTLTETQQSGYESAKIEVTGTGASNINIDLANCKATFTIASAADVTVIYTNRETGKPGQTFLMCGNAWGYAKVGNYVKFTSNINAYIFTTMSFGSTCNSGVTYFQGAFCIEPNILWLTSECVKITETISIYDYVGDVKKANKINWLLSKWSAYSGSDKNQLLLAIWAYLGIPGGVQNSLYDAANAAVEDPINPWTPTGCTGVVIKNEKQ